MDAFMGSVLGALLAVLASTLLIGALFFLVWKPYVVTRWFRGQGIGGPSYRFLVGSLPEIKRMKAAGSKITLDVGSHDFVPIVQPQYRRWVSDYGMHSV
jgi:cytochrome P450 family 709